MRDAQDCCQSFTVVGLVGGEKVKKRRAEASPRPGQGFLAGRDQIDQDAVDFLGARHGIKNGKHLVRSQVTLLRSEARAPERFVFPSTLLLSLFLFLKHFSLPVSWFPQRQR
jgi:hypothetical protein